jgi:hypothetical protein
LKKLDDATLLAACEAMHLCGNQRAAAKHLGVAQSAISERVAEAKKRGLLFQPKGQEHALEAVEMPLPEEGKHVYLLTCAQDHTALHKPLWKNLLALAEHDHAKIMVSTFIYNKDALGQRNAAKFETREQELAAKYPQEIIPFICDDRVDLAPALTFCGELNVLPTAVNPLEGLASYTYRKSTIVPHPKLALQSVPTMRDEGVKLMFTTGACTMRNYIKRKVGYKAEHFHSYGALLVEIDAKGRWYCRQLQMGADGAIYDLDRRVKDGKVTTGHRVEAITWGDVHAGRRDIPVSDVSWGRQPGSMLEVLRPKKQFVHDLLDFSGRSHHTRRDPHAVFKSHLTGEWVLADELEMTASVLWDDIARDWCETIVVNSNHDRHLDVFLKEMDWRDDPANATLILSLNLLICESMVAGKDKELCLLKEALLRSRRFKDVAQVRNEQAKVRFLLEDESYVLLPDIDGGIECGLHGDRGANGAKGTIVGIANIDRKINGADKHTVAIMNHAYFCGTSSLLKQPWNHGMSSWTHAHTVTYPNGTRAIVSVWKGKWRA